MRRNPLGTALDRALAEASLYEYTRMAWPVIEPAPFIDGWHIGFLCEHLQAVTQGQIPKLLINVPPGCSKSLTTCVFWATWEWTTDAAVRWLFASYDQRLSTRDSVKCRALIESAWYQHHWGERFHFKGDQNQKTYYETDKGGYRLATSVGGHGTGEHPDRIVIDDPHDVKGAESESERQAVLAWWDLTMTTRGVSRKARRVIIMQRLHEKDLSGHVLEQGGWTHICLPMRYEPGRMISTPLGKTDLRTEPGALLTPEQFPEETVKEMETLLGPYGTAGQLQQRPAPAEGGLFKREWLRYYGRRGDYYVVGGKMYMPGGIKERFLTVDTASTEKKHLKQDPDWTVVSAWGVTPCGMLLWLGCVPVQVEGPAVPEVVAASYLRHGALLAEVEGGGTQNVIVQLVRNHELAPGRRMNVVMYSPDRDKVARSLHAAAAMAAGKVWLPSPEADPNFPLARVESEVLTFPGASHDDIVDTLSQACRRLMVRPQQSGKVSTLTRGLRPV